MLVTFETKAYANITMFGDIAVTLIKFMGHSGGVPGALLAEDVPAALERLRAAVSAQADTPLDPPPAHNAGHTGPAHDDRDAVRVSLAHRALPLIALLEAAARDRENVMWDH